MSRTAADFHLGQLVISEFDAPSVRMLGVVSEIAKYRITALYLWKDPRTWCDLWGPPSRMTPVSDFGVEVVFDDVAGRVTASQVRPSVATYDDGKPRPWQPGGFVSCACRRAVRLRVRTLDGREWSQFPGEATA